jgi:hypothetical protein
MIAYWRERFDLRIFLPAAAVIAGAAQVGHARLDPTGLIVDAASTLALLAQFRLWDDLADRERDRREHPDRVLPRAADVTPFAAACVWLGILNLSVAAWGGGTLSASLLALLDAAAAVWYAARPAGRTAASDLVLLAKYPAFVLIVAEAPAGSGWALAASAGLVYVAACAFEIWHDATGPLRFTNS